MQADLARHGSPKQMATWLCDGLIGEDEVVERLTVIGWPLADQGRLIVESCRGLSASQILKLVAKGLIQRDDALQRLQMRGIDSSDANLLIDEACSAKGAQCGTQ